MTAVVTLQKKEHKFQEQKTEVMKVEVTQQEVIDEKVEDDEEEVQGSGSEEVDEEPNWCLPNPLMPTKEMVDAHNVSHLPYSNWCASCVRARERRFPHRKIEQMQDRLPVISGDCFISE